MRNPYFTALALVFYIFGCSPKEQPTYISDNLVITPLTSNTWVQVSYLESETFGKVACNGLLYKSGEEVIVFDTPTEDAVSEELIAWIEEALDAKVTGVVVNHHHIDCLGGLEAFHKRGIASYTSYGEIFSADTTHVTVPRFGFDGSDTLRLADGSIINFYPGPGHTQHNIVSYLPEESVIFGGCMVKSLKAGKGNLADADTLLWSQSIRKVLATFPDAQIIVPGHGPAGGKELLEYTAAMFESN